MDTILVIVAWIHVLSAIMWFGGALAMEFVFTPVLMKGDFANKGAMLMAMGKKFGLIAQITSGLILLTGLYRVYAVIGLDLGLLLTSVWGNLLLIKVLLFFVFAGIGINIGLKIEKLQPDISQENLEAFLGKIKLLQYIDIAIGVIIILLAVTLRYSPYNFT